MSLEERVAAHYASADIVARVREALRANGVDPDAASADDLKAVDEFHIGGAAATRALFDQLDIEKGSHAVDIGAGLGGPARLMASEYDCTVIGVDITPEFVDAAAALSAMVGLSGQTRFELGGALALPLDAEAVDVATLIHVGMNIDDKAGALAEAFRVLRPGGRFGVYDVMRTGGGALAFPAPWATTDEASFVEPFEVYAAAAKDAGFEISATRNRRDFALEFFAAMRARAIENGPPPISISLIMDDALLKIETLIVNIADGLIAPTELILKKPG